MTNTKAAANYLASKGRYGDSTLVHMSPIEVWALERMSPNGKLPRNPDTGMPEAFDLGSILPAVVGIGANILTGGAITPLMAGALSGLTSFATTGDLGKGLMSGLLSYGLGSALDTASGVADQALTEGAKQGAAQGASQVATQAPASIPGAQLGGALSGGSAPSMFGDFGLTSSYSPPADLMNGALGGAGQSVVNPATTIGSGMGDRLGAALSNFQADPTGTLSRTFIDNYKSTTLPIVGSMLASSAMEPPAPLNVKKEPTSEELQRQYPEQFPDKREVRFPGSDYEPGTSPEFDYFSPFMAGGGLASLMANPDLVYAKGGVADPDGEKAAKANIAVEAKMALLDHHPKAEEALARYERTFGADALAKLKSSVFKPGGRIRGAGGGLDDLIPGTIEGRRDVRLADGEFVVPADVVSMLGDGSSDHGVRKLHEMMDRVRVQKTGTKKQAKFVEDKKVLPA